MIVICLCIMSGVIINYILYLRYFCVNCVNVLCMSYSHIAQINMCSVTIIYKYLEHLKVLINCCLKTGYSSVEFGPNTLPTKP